MSGAEQFYTERLNAFSLEIAGIKKRLLVINTGRLIFFALFLITPFWLYPKIHWLGIICPLISIIIFLMLVVRNGSVATRKRYLENRIQICTNEIAALSHNFSCFDPGSEFIDPEHINSYDLDLFGKGSIFQFINRTVTFKGKGKLASMLCNPILISDNLIKRQELVKELVNDCDWRHDFAAKGMMYTENQEESEQFNKWGKEKYVLRTGEAVLFLIIILPVLSILSIAYWIVLKNSAFFVFAGLLQAVFWIIERKNISTIFEKFGKREEILSKYASLLAMIEKREWMSAEAREIIHEIGIKGIPSKEIAKLKKIISLFDNRQNFIAGFFLNIILSWDLLFSYLLIRWNERNNSNYELWDSTIAFFDAVSSLSNIAYNHPAYCYPVMQKGKFQFEAEQMGHPLINPQKVKTNTFSIGLKNQIIIVTGANMAGKSTFLRTVGVNMVLAMTGAPVFATSMKFVPVEVFSNMRTTDSLFDEESYFFAELKRIKAILDAVESGKPVLIILDEILKGTNSIDKLSGSQKLVKKLIGLHAPAIIATHDLKLTEMKAEYPDDIQNHCFEIKIEDEEMFFDYKLCEGVTQTMNATFLMKKMGIV